MRRKILASVALLPVLLAGSYAAQDWSSSHPSQTWVYSSDDGGGSSYLGVDIADITPERLGALKLKEEKGVEVNFVDPDSPAGKAGMKEHDVILSINGTPIDSAAQLRRVIHETPAGRVITLGLSRDGQPLSVKVQLADKHKEFSNFSWATPNVHVEVPEIHIPDIEVPSMVVVTSSMHSGLMVENITAQLGEFFGVKNGDGVLVRSVDKGSRADKAGFRAGDVIVKINDQEVHDTSDFSHAVKSRNGNSVSIGVIRDKREQTLTLALPDRKESRDLFWEESLEGHPRMEAESSLELSQLENEIAKLQPQMELAQADALKAYNQAQKSYCNEQKRFQEKLRKEAEGQRKTFEDQQEKLEQQFDRVLEQSRRDML
jgi:serine protease Do